MNSPAPKLEPVTPRKRVRRRKANTPMPPRQLRFPVDKWLPDSRLQAAKALLGKQSNILPEAK